MMPWPNSKHDVVMQMAALGRTSYAKISQQHYFNTVVSTRDMLKQSHSAVGLKQYNSAGSTWTVHGFLTVIQRLYGIVVAHWLCPSYPVRSSSFRQEAS